MREGWEFSDAGARRLSARAARAADFFTAAVLALETGWLIVFASFYVVWLLDGEPNFSFHGDPPVPKTPFYEDIPWLLALTLLVAGFLLAAFAVLRGGSHAGTIRIALSSGLLVALLANGGAALYLAYKQLTFAGDLIPWILVLSFVSYMCVRCLLRPGSPTT